jgi:transcriptional regulator with PAS, ATPase and Fis domain
MMLVDRQGRVVWINEAYKRFLPALGFEREEDFVGRPVAEVVPNTLMHQVIETGKPILIDLLTNRAGTFVVSRIPLRDDDGEVIGALGMVLFDHPETTLQPLIGKFARLQRDLDDARRELAAQRRTRYTFESFIGASAVAVEVKRQARRAARVDASVLLLGETGTGKELLAQAIHAGSARADKPFIGVNLAAVPETLIEAEFFGVAPGAYTGADRKGRDGKFRLADGGTLFLDEVGDMPLALQAKLLRALQEQEIEPLGSNRVLKVDVRVIAATSRELQALVADGRFRADLFYRLNVLPIRLPALRERASDLEAIAEDLLNQIAQRTGMPQRELTPSALRVLAVHPWPGNVRELRNVLEQAAMLTDNVRLTEADFAPALASSAGVAAAVATAAEPARSPGTAARPPAPLPQAIAELERKSILSALEATGGNKVSAARLLGISRATLYEKLAAIKAG